MQTADRALAELAPDNIQDLKEVHDKVDRWLEARHPLDWFGDSVAKKSIVESSEMAVVKDENLERLIEKLSGQGGSLFIRDRMKAELKGLLFTEQISASPKHFVVEDKPGGTRYMEKFMLYHRKQNDLNYIAFAYYSNIQELTKDWKWLVNNHHDGDISKWLDYKLYMQLQSKVAASRRPMTCTQLAHKMQSSKLSSVELERQLVDAQSSGVCSSNELKPFGDKLLALWQGETQETMLKYLDEAVTENNERRLQQLLEQAEQEKNVSPKALEKYKQELRNLRESRTSKNEELEAERKLEEALLANNPSCDKLLDELMQFRGEAHLSPQRDRCKEIKKKHQETIFNRKREEALETVKEILESGDGDCEAALRKAKEEGVEAILLQEHGLRMHELARSRGGSLRIWTAHLSQKMRIVISC